MRNAVLSVLLVITLVGVILFGFNQMTSSAETTTPVAAVTADDLGVCVPGVICTTVYLPGPTVRVTVSQPVTIAPVTVRVPPVTVTRIINLPGTVRTILVPVEGGTRTVTVPVAGLPGATTTATVVVNREIIRNGTAPPVTREVRSTVPAGRQTVTSSATVTPSKEVIHLPGTTKTVTKFQAVGLSLLGLLALMGLGFFLLWLGFILGYRSSEKENTNFLRALRDTFKRPGKHQ